MSGLERLLDQVDRQTDATVGRLGMSAPAVTDGTAEGRFTLPGLIALLAAGAQDRPRHSLAAQVITPATISARSTRLAACAACRSGCRKPGRS